MLFSQLKKTGVFNWAVALVLTVTSGAATSGNLNIADEPLYLGGAVAPNVMFILDDSGSMHWENMPSNSSYNIYVYPNGSRGVYRGSGSDTGDYSNYAPLFSDNIFSIQARTSHINKLYYNPDRRYTPWPGTDRDGNPMTNAVTTCALHNGYEPDADNDGNDREAPEFNGSSPDGVSHDCRDLTRYNREYATYIWNNGGGLVSGTGNHTFWPAIYYRYISGNENTVSNYEKVEISSSTDTNGSTNQDLYPPTGNRHANRTDCAGATKCTFAEEIQNFANWYTYYRSRILIARAGVGRAFDVQSTKMRVGFGSINDTSGTDTIIDGVKKFEGADRSAWFDLLYGHRMPRSGTPLRTALRDAGEYYKSTSDSGPWSETPGTTNTNPHLTCRQSYSVLMTDGYWNGGTPSVNNSDDTTGPTITNHASSTPPNYTYTPGPPYEDNHWNTLADVAMEYWKNDLRTDLNNEVPPNPEDEAFWQHMVTYTVGLGVEGDLDPVVTEARLLAGTDPGWPQPGSDRTANIDDMWHAAVNSRGAFFSASDPDTFAQSLSSILINLTSRTSSASSVALNSSSFVTDSTVYQARFDTGNWTGQLLAQSVSKDANGDLQFTVDWDAANGIPSVYTNRKIVTYDGTNGQPFEWGTLTGTQQTLMGNTNVVNYLRGDTSFEGSVYRNRPTKLGDIINSSPFYVGSPAAGYKDNWGSGQPESDPNTKYSDFRSTHYNRTPMIYVGANDGMLHAFNATTDATDLQQGMEQMAYVPNTIMRNLPNLANTSYQHEYFVDGSPVARDAYIDGAWHTVLVSGLNAGGQGIFALDVTSAPSISDSASTAAGKVLWEFGDSATGFSDGDADLGYTFGRPNIVRLHNGKWAAVFGNGYNNTADDDGDGGATNDSATGDASLFIVDLETGVKIRKISTLTGTAEDPTGAARPNGLGNVTPIDINGDSITDYVYGGDLFGNVWKFDLTDSTAANWDVAYKSGTTPLPLFTARADQTDATTAQPITSRISVARHPDEYGGFMVYFGTGKYLESGDNERTGQDNQTLYGIWDRAEDTNGDGVKDLYAFDKDDLLQQTILGEITTASGSYRILSDYDIVYHEQNNLDAIYAPSVAPDASSSTPTSLSTATHLGWYIDLLNTQGGNTNNNGEKIVSDPIVRISNLLVTTLIPSKDACDFGGESWTLEPDLSNGGSLDESRYDVNADSTFSLGDYVAVDGSGNYVSIDADGDGVIDSQYDQDGDGVVDPEFDLDGDGIPDNAVAVSGKKIESGIASAPKLLRDEDDDTTSEIYNTSSGILEVFKKSEELFEGRQSWIELFR